MNRVEQLTLDLLDGVLDEAGLLQLEQLLAADAAAREIHFQLCRQEATLRGQLSEFDVSRQAMDRVRAGAAQPQPSPIYLPGELPTRPLPCASPDALPGQPAGQEDPRAREVATAAAVPVALAAAASLEEAAGQPAAGMPAIYEEESE